MSAAMKSRAGGGRGAGRAGLFDRPHHMVQAEVIEYLRRQVFDDAVAACWLTPCLRKPGRGKDTVFYRTRDVEDVSLRIAGGEYPQRKEGASS